MNDPLLIIVLLGIVFAFYTYGKITFTGGWHTGFKKGYFDGQIKGAEASLTLLHKLGIIDADKLAQDILEGKYNSKMSPNEIKHLTQ